MSPLLYAKLVDGKVVPISDRGLTETERNDALLDWAKWSSENKVIARTGDGVQMVSTVFLGLNHGWGEKELWFETLVFGGPFADTMCRYETLDEAKAGHEKMCERVFGKGGPLGTVRKNKVKTKPKRGMGNHAKKKSKTKKAKRSTKTT